MFLIEQNIVNLTHNDSARVSVSVGCLALVTMYGNSRRKLSVRTNEILYFPFLFLKLLLFLCLTAIYEDGTVFRNVGT